MLKKRYPNLKVLASIGGWTYSPAFHSKVQTAASRKALVTSCVNLYKKYSMAFDGLDIDLEYPCLPNDTACGLNITPSPDDKGNFAALMEEFRLQLGSNTLLTMAGSADPKKIDALDFARLDKVLDSYNIMTYDFTSGSWGDKSTGHMAQTYGNPADPIATR